MTQCRDGRPRPTEAYSLKFVARSRIFRTVGDACPYSFNLLVGFKLPNKLKFECFATAYIITNERRR